MNKTAIMSTLHEVADYRLFGSVGWPACGESIAAFFRTIRALGLEEAVDGTMRYTSLGNEVSVELMTVFAGGWHLFDIPYILADGGYIEWDEMEELCDLPESEFEAKLRLRVTRLYLDFCGRFKLLH
jgi:hypothetical protein